MHKLMEFFFAFFILQNPRRWIRWYETQYRILGWPNQWRKKEEDSWRLFVDTIRNTAAAKMALLVPKGVQRYPDSGDKVKGMFNTVPIMYTWGRNY